MILPRSNTPCLRTHPSHTSPCPIVKLLLPLCIPFLSSAEAARGARYQRNHEVLVTGMKTIGFHVFLKPEVQSYIITSFYYPNDPKFTFNEFYRRLSDKGFIIYPGKISQADTFRIGSIGRIFESDMRQLLAAVAETRSEMGIHMTPGR